MFINIKLGEIFTVNGEKFVKFSRTELYTGDGEKFYNAISLDTGERVYFRPLEEVEEW